MNKNSYSIIALLICLLSCVSCSSDNDSNTGSDKQIDQGQGELEMIYSIADEMNMKVICDFNLSGGGYYGKYAARDLVSRCDEYIKLYYNSYGHHSSFWGWYINTEINPLTKVNLSKSTFWRELWKGVTASCHKVAPNSKVTIAPFFIMDKEKRRGFSYIEPEEYTDWWYETLKETDIDILMMQDSGAEHLSFFTLGDREVFYKAFAAACRKAGKEFWADIETGEIVANNWDEAISMESSNTQVWRFTPIDWLQEKLELAAQYCTGIVNWGYYPYMDPNEGHSILTVQGSGMDNATRQANYNAYLNYQKSVSSSVSKGMKALPKINGTLWWFPATGLDSMSKEELENSIRTEITNQKNLGFDYIWIVNACNHFVIK